MDHKIRDQYKMDYNSIISEVKSNKSAAHVMIKGGVKPNASSYHSIIDRLYKGGSRSVVMIKITQKFFLVFFVISSSECGIVLFIVCLISCPVAVFVWFLLKDQNQSVTDSINDFGVKVADSKAFILVLYAINLDDISSSTALLLTESERPSLTRDGRLRKLIGEVMAIYGLVKVK
ncbi:transmembrane protein, putative [Medicago truncatula]|uniref:Transmembrane protein, putative n=1 Tax=Medicago truncatula TaxID=3880 RepID=A0A072V6K6_MEDTR|nr:transmembrane protein, putative [Medicago truncatula]